MEKRRRGGQPGNRNAKGHGAPYGNSNACGHGAPVGNRNAVKHGLYETFVAPTSLDLAVVRYMDRAGIPFTLTEFSRIKSAVFAEMRRRWRQQV